MYKCLQKHFRHVQNIFFPEPVIYIIILQVLFNLHRLQSHTTRQEQCFILKMDMNRGSFHSKTDISCQIRFQDYNGIAKLFDLLNCQEVLMLNSLFLNTPLSQWDTCCYLRNLLSRHYILKVSFVLFCPEYIPVHRTSMWSIYSFFRMPFRHHIKYVPWNMFTVMLRFILVWSYREPLDY